MEANVGNPSVPTDIPPPSVIFPGDHTVVVMNISINEQDIPSDLLQAKPYPQIMPVIVGLYRLQFEFDRQDVPRRDLCIGCTDTPICPL
jgi:hypothetical protein